MKFCHGMIGVEPLDWCRIAKVCEEAGFDTVTLSDHVIYPENLSSKYPYTPDGSPLFDPTENWPDVWVAMGAMAAITTKLTFLTNVYVLPARNPFVAAKAIGTAAVLSGDRVAIGVGAGWMREEFELMEQPFKRRGARMEEMIEVMRTLWKGGMAEFHGEFYDFDPVEMRPAPNRSVPIHIGGHSEIAFDRAARIGDGWLGLYYPAKDLIEHCRHIHQIREDVGTADRHFEIIASPLEAPTPDLLDDLEEAGVTSIITSSWFSKGISAPEISKAEELIHRYAQRFIHPRRGHVES